MTDKEKSQTMSNDVDKFLASIDKTYKRIENDLTNSLTEIRTLRWMIEDFNEARMSHDMKRMHKMVVKMKKDAKEAAVSMSQVAEETKQQKEEVVVKDKSATIELAHHKLTREIVQEITRFLAHSSKWSWIDFQWSIEKDKTKT